jgi:CNT family concentrative nucleoside transporter
MFKIVHFLLALVIILALAWLVSFDRRKIRIRYVLQLIVIEIALAFFFLHAESGLFLIKYVSGFLSHCLNLLAKAPISSLAEWVKKGWRSFSSACFARLFLFPR